MSIGFYLLISVVVVISVCPCARIFGAEVNCKYPWNWWNISERPLEIADRPVRSTRSWLIHQAVATKDQTHFLAVVYSRLPEYYQHLPAQPVDWLVVTFPRSGAVATVHQPAPKARSVSIEAFQESSVVITTKVNNEPPLQPWIWSTGTRQVMPFDVESLSEESKDFPMSTRLVLAEIADRYPGQKLKLASLPHTKCTRSFGLVDATSSECTVSHGLADTEIVIAQNKPCKVGCWNVITGNEQWNLPIAKVLELNEGDEEKLGTDVSCWIPSSTYKGQTEIPAFFAIDSKYETRVLGINSQGDARYICNTDVDYPECSPIISSSGIVFFLGYPRLAHRRNELVPNSCTTS